MVCLSAQSVSSASSAGCPCWEGASVLRSRSGSMKRRKCADSPTSVPGSDALQPAISTRNTQEDGRSPGNICDLRLSVTLLCKEQTVERRNLPDATAAIKASAQG